MGWIYHANLNDNDSDNDSYNEAFNIFLNQCLIHKDRIYEQLSQNNCYRFVIRTDGDNDKIYCKDGKFFLKSKFLNRKSFKKKLIDYYRPLGIYVTGPREFTRHDGTETKRWMIELTYKR